MTTFFVQDFALTEGTTRSVDANGFLTGQSVLARSGILKYRRSEIGMDGGNETVNVYRPPEEVAKAVPLYDGLPITLNHPPDLLSPQNARRYGVGHVSYPSSGEAEGEVLVKSRFTITDQRGIETLSAGVDQLSVGAQVSYDYTPGIAPDGTPYQAVQREIRPNHVAIVERGRCGPQCRALDQQTDEEKPMAKLKIGDKEYEVDQAVADAFSKQQGKTAAMEAELKKAKEGKAKDAAPGIANDTQLMEALHVVEAAKSFIPSYDYAAKSVTQMRLDVCDHLGITVDKENEVAVKSAFDAACQLQAKQSEALDKQAKTMTDAFLTTDSGDEVTVLPSVAAREEYLSEGQE